MSNEISEQRSFSLAPQNIEEALKFAEMLSKSDFVPKDFQNKPGNILVAVQWGMELGMQPMQAMQNIAPINGRPSLWGDAVIALVKSSSACEYIVEDVNDTKAICKVKRRGEPEQCREFTVEDAKKAGLWGKSGPWTQYPKRMLQMRARSWALRDVFPDVLRGMPIAEELQDMATTAKERDITSQSQVVIGDYPEDKFNANREAWRGVVESGRKSADDLIATINSKAKDDKVVLTINQENEIRSWKAKPAADVDDFIAGIERKEGAENANA